MLRSFYCSSDQAIASGPVVAAERLRGHDVGAVAEGLALAWLDAKTSESEAFRALYGIAAEFDLEEGMGRVLDQMTGVFFGPAGCGA